MQYGEDLRLKKQMAKQIAEIEEQNEIGSFRPRINKKSRVMVEQRKMQQLQVDMSELQLDDFKSGDENISDDILSPHRAPNTKNGMAITP